LTSLLWPAGRRRRANESATRQTATEWSADPDIRYCESGVNVTEYLCNAGSSSIQHSAFTTAAQPAEENEENKRENGGKASEGRKKREAEDGKEKEIEKKKGQK